MFTSHSPTSSPPPVEIDTFQCLPALSVSLTMMIPSFQTGRSGANSVDPDQTTPEQSDQGLHCLLFRLHVLDAFLYGITTLFTF